MKCFIYSAFLLASCSSATQTVGLGAALIPASVAPGSAISQTYYLGVFDPEGQLPPTLYRVRVRGHASILNSTNFSSGWVKSSLLDTLALTESPSIPGVLGVEEATSSEIERKGESQLITTQIGDLDLSRDYRRLVAFGPDGFRPAPENHRLVIVMGSNPAGFFKAVDKTLGSLAKVELGLSMEDERQLVESMLHELRSERLEILSLEDQLREERVNG